MAATTPPAPKVAIPILLALSLPVAGCLDVGGASEPRRTESAELVGTWTLEMDDTGCVPDLDGITHYFRIDDDDTEVTPGGLMNISSEWSPEPDFEPARPMSGTVDFSTDSVALNLFARVPDPRIGFRATLIGTQRMEGIFFETAGGVNHDHNCRGPAVAQR